MHPELGTIEDSTSWPGGPGRRLQIALDLAFQGSPDHPWVKEHPRWFRERCDGTIQYAENPPKKYRGIYQFDFDTPDWRGLWDALLSTFSLFWIGLGRRDVARRQPAHEGVPVLGVADRRGEGRQPGTMFLAEAFTRPDVKYRLARWASPGATPTSHGAIRSRSWSTTSPEIAARRCTTSSGQRLAEHARHPPRVCSRRPAEFVRACYGGDARRHLRDLRARVRAGRERSPRARQRGVPELGEVRDADVGPRPARLACAADRRGQPDPPRTPGPPSNERLVSTTSTTTRSSLTRRTADGATSS